MSDQEKAASVFDILYADVRRLSSLLSQLNDEGVLTEISRAVEDTTAANIELSVKVVKGGASEAGRQSRTTKVDPSWLVPLLFLDASKDDIRRDITEASIGSLVHVSGKLVVTDLGFLKEMWKSAAIRRQIIKAAAESQVEVEPANRHERRALKKPKQDNTEQEALFEILPLLPHSPQFNIVTDDFAVWGTIDPQHMVGTVGDLVLKHGSKVPGSWSVVGILDAVPFEQRDDEDYDDILSFFERLRIGMMTENVWKAAIEMAQPARQALGRPFLSYGVTPLVIFREIER